MTLRDLIAAHPAMFAAQTWYEEEAFMGETASSTEPIPPTHIITTDHPTDYPLPRAVFLVRCYLAAPSLLLWRRYLWTATMDQYGQRIYLGVE